MHPTPASADVCTTLPPSNLPLRDRLQNTDDRDCFWLDSDCGRIHIGFFKQHPSERPGAPIGTWNACETRIDSNGEKWIRADRGVYYVVDNFGFLARVVGQGGAA